MKLLAGLLFALMASPTFAQEVKPSIEPVAGDVYLMRNNFHNSLLVVTGDGVAAAICPRAGAQKQR